MSFQCFLCISTVQWVSCDLEHCTNWRICTRETANVLIPETNTDKINIYFLLVTFLGSSLKMLLQIWKKKTFMKCKSPFVSHLVASSAWPPAVIPSLQGGRESHCNKEKNKLKIAGNCINGNQVDNMVSFQINKMDVFTVINYILRNLKVFLVFLLWEKVFFSCNNTSIHLWTFQFAWLVVKPSVTLAASELKPSALLSLMNPVILTDQLKVIAIADKREPFWMSVVIPWRISAELHIMTMLYSTKHMKSMTRLL